MKTIVSGFLFIACLGLSALRLFAMPTSKSYLSWSELAELPAVSEQSEPIGVAGAFVGVHRDALIIAGGANFDKPYWENEKEWHSDIWVLVRQDEQSYWKFGGKLKHPVAYGASVSTPAGVLCMGGSDAERTYDEVFLLKWNPESEKTEVEAMPSLPTTCAFTSAAVIGDRVYIAGGTKTNELASAMNNFWVLDLSQMGSEDFGWRSLPGWPGPSRGFNMTVAQHNGKADCIYVIGGRRQNSDGKIEFLKDIYEFNPSVQAEHNEQSAWRKRQDAPVCRMAGVAVAIGQSHIFLLGGADGSLFNDANQLKDKHPGFPRELWAYHTITDTWVRAGPMPQNHVTTQPTKWRDDYIVAGGEIKPRVMTPKIWKVTPVKTAKSFGWIDYSIIIIYLASLVAMGVFFSFHNRDTEDFFRGGQKIPWWAAGSSIFATMLSSLTFMSIPAKSYTTDWVYIIINIGIVVLAPFIIYFILPFFRKIDATSAYEYLELRFNLIARLIASASYILFQIGRMAIVMFLPALALSTVAPISVEMSILLMGLMSIIYCTLGGIEAVIWTDTLQTVVLLGGALLSFIIIILNLDGGFASFFATAMAADKFRVVEWDWGVMSYTTSALWVMVIGGLAQSLVPYTSDQGVVQRYMSVSTEKNARRAIWTNAGLSFFGSILFFAVGTGLYVFYKTFPDQLDPTLQNDSIFPQFISGQLPVGIAGIVIAGVFAAAQSTVSTSMNSIATAFSTDFIRRFDLLKTEKGYFNLARIVTLLAGIFGTAVALLFATADIKNMWDAFMKILGLLGGPIGGLFLLGMFSRRAHGTGAIIGAVFSAVVLAFVQLYTETSFILYAAIGVVGCIVSGYLFSLIIPASFKTDEGLTIFDLNK